MSRPPITSKALRDTSVRILKKLTVVLLAVVAFFSLRALENAKTEYEKERAQPIVIVDADPGSSDTNREFVIKLDSETVRKELEKIIDPAPRDSELSTPGATAIQTLSGPIRTSIRDARRTPFRNQEEFVEYLSSRITAGKAAADKYLSDTKAQRIKLFDELGTNKGGVAHFEKELGDRSDKKFLAKFETAKEAKRESLTAGAELTPQDLVTLAKKADDERDLEDQKLVSDAAYKNIDRLHSHFVPVFLTPYVRSRKDPSPLSSSFSEMVFDERRGGHVIYQVFYLSFICVLVFGVLFPIYLLLRIFPAFSSGVEPLKDQAKGLLSRRGAAAVAAPALMKTVALSAAAVGVGAAVVIANNPVTSTKPPADVAIASETGTNGHPPDRPPKGPGGYPVPSPRPSPEVGPETTPSPTTPLVETEERPINLYPTFYPTFRMNDPRVARLERENLETKNLVELLKTDKLGKQEFKEQAAGFVTNDQLTTRVADLPVIKSEVSNLKLGVTDLTTKEIPTLRADLEKTGADLTTRLDDNIRAIVGFREGTQGRSIGSRTRELLGREQYEARPESNRILRQLMCRAPCEKEERILSKLDALVGQGKMRKDTFLGRLGIRPSRTVPRSDWEALILRYSRVPY